MRLNGPDYETRAEKKMNYRRVLLPEAYARINECKKIRESVEECLSGTEYEKDISRILSYVERVNTSSKCDLYRGSLHEFGRTSGIAIYNMLKNVV